MGLRRPQVVRVGHDTSYTYGRVPCGRSLRHVLFAAAQAANVINMVNLSYRDAPAIQHARALVTGGAIGNAESTAAACSSSCSTKSLGSSPTNTVRSKRNR
mgnify:CR=1 FL=1